MAKPAKHYHIVIDVVTSETPHEMLAMLDAKKMQGWSSYATCKRRATVLSQELDASGVKVVYATTRSCIEEHCEIDAEKHKPWGFRKKAEEAACG